MGQYNPDTPKLLGQQWAPIREENIEFAPAVNSIERGYSYTLQGSRTVRDARFYLSEFPNPTSSQQVALFNTYPAGQEALSGPIREVIIPVSFASITGFGGTQYSIIGGGSLADALLRPDDVKYINFAQMNNVFTRFSLWFDTPSYPQLAGKRILNVSLLYSGTAADSDLTGHSGDASHVFAAPIPLINPDPLSPLTLVTLNRFGQGVNYSTGAYSNLGALNQLSPPIPAPLGAIDNGATIGSLDLGDINTMWNGSFVGTDVMPWTYNNDLLFFHQAAGVNRFELVVLIQIPITTYATGHGGSINMYYAALRVMYCEETRVITGGRYMGYQGPTNIITQRTLAQAADPVLTQGAYTTTLSFVSPGDRSLFTPTLGNDVKVNGLREQYAMPDQPGVNVKIPFPLDEGVGAEFTKESSHVLPQISLHTPTGSVLTEIHPYGRQSVAQVFGSNTATQEILGNAAGIVGSYPQVRFFARRWGNTSVPLTLSGVGPGSGLAVAGQLGSNATTPDNAALDIVGDIDIRADVTMDHWADGSFKTVVSKWNENGVNQRSYLLQVNEIGGLQFVWSSDGTNLFVTNSTVPTGMVSGRLAVRATMDVDNGASGRTITFYTAPTSAGPYVQLGAQVIQAGVTSIFNSTTQGEVSGHSGSAGPDALPYTVYNVQILNGIAGTQVANPDFAAQAPGTTSFTDAAGRVWTINGNAAIVAGISSTNSASITPAQFDALPEILDGWKQVDLRFTSPPSMGSPAGGAGPSWTWTATGELAGNRWEVLGATAPALASTTGNPFALSQQLRDATYGNPLGAAINETWMPGDGPYFTTSTSDDTSDVTVIFSQDMPTITGFNVATANQPLTGVGLDCVAYPWYMPTSLSYNQLSWPSPPGYMLDTFSTPAVSGWSAMDTGQTWTPVSPDIGSFSVSGGTGKVSVSTVNTSYDIESNVGTSDQDVTFYVTIGSLPTGGELISDLRIRKTDVNNLYITRLDINGTSLRAQIYSVVSGVATLRGDAPLPYPAIAGRTYGLRGSAIGSIIRMKLWDTAVENEPDNWNISISNTDVPPGTKINVTSFLGSGTTNPLPYVFNYDNLTSNVNSFGYYEIQRSDTLTDWQTIAHMTSAAATGFKDYEARIGVPTSYRIRGVNSYLFGGPWSSMATLTMASPGLTGQGMTADAFTTIFTSNNRQDGSRNLAYALAFQSDTTENFNFPEAGFTQYQLMYNRDFQVAFRPTERGGEVFSRDILVQGASIPPETLADFKSLRDMAWDSLPYVCVRDGDGNRWFANVTVPSGRVQNRRKLYVASINVTEVTDTAAVVTL